MIDGVIQELYQRYDGVVFVIAKPEGSYSVSFHNKTRRAIEATCGIDGCNVLTGGSASTANAGVTIRGGDILKIDSQVEPLFDGRRPLVFGQLEGAISVAVRDLRRKGGLFSNDEYTDVSISAPRLAVIARLDIVYAPAATVHPIVDRPPSGFVDD
jgi:hypothetical protein